MLDLTQTPASVSSNLLISDNDLRSYLKYLDETNLSEAQRMDVLQILWSMMSGLVDLTFGANSEQHVPPSVSGDPDAVKVLLDALSVTRHMKIASTRPR